MAQTYEQVAYSVLGGTAASVTFSSIATTWTDLQLICVPIATAGGNDFQIQVNGDTATNYSDAYAYGNRTTVSGTVSNTVAQWDLDTALAGVGTAPKIYTVDFFQYKNISINKPIIFSQMEDISASGYVGVGGGLWRSTAAINSIAIKISGSTFATGSTFALYGIKAA